MHRRMRQRSGHDRLPWCLATLALVLVGAAAPAQEHDYVGVKKCSSCHRKQTLGDQVSQWQKNPHARAFETLSSERSLAIAKAAGLETKPSEAAECLRCHLTAYGVPDIRIAYPLDLDDGVQCESCHGPGRDYRKKSVMSEPERAHANGLWHAEKDATLCTQCHNDESPTFDSSRYTLPDGSKSGFDFEQAVQKILHPIPTDTKGRYLEIEKEFKALGKKLP